MKWFKIGSDIYDFFKVCFVGAIFNFFFQNFHFEKSVIINGDLKSLSRFDRLREGNQILIEPFLSILCFFKVKEFRIWTKLMFSKVNQLRKKKKRNREMTTFFQG